MDCITGILTMIAPSKAEPEQPETMPLKENGEKVGSSPRSGMVGGLIHVAAEIASRTKASVLELMKEEEEEPPTPFQFRPSVGTWVNAGALAGPRLGARGELEAAIKSQEPGKLQLLQQALAKCHALGVPAETLVKGEQEVAQLLLKDALTERSPTALVAAIKKAERTGIDGALLKRYEGAVTLLEQYHAAMQEEVKVQAAFEEQSAALEVKEVQVRERRRSRSLSQIIFGDEISELLEKQASTMEDKVKDADEQLACAKGFVEHLDSLIVKVESETQGDA